jgi:hypothetical protein
MRRHQIAADEDGARHGGAAEKLPARGHAALPGCHYSRRPGRLVAVRDGLPRRFSSYHRGTRGGEARYLSSETRGGTATWEDHARPPARWTELDGPPVTREPVPGFGIKLISRVIGYDLQGSAATRFEPGGLRCRLTFRIAAAPELEAADAAPLTA